MNPAFDQAMNAGVTLHRQGRFEEARRHYEQALAIIADQPDALNLIGLTWFQARDAERAIDFLRQAIAGRPDFPDAHLNLGSALASLRRFDEAIACFETAALQAPDYPNAHFNLGMALKDSRRSDEAIVHLARALELVPQHLGALMTLGAIFAEKTRFTKAEEYFRQAVKAQPNYAEAYLNLGSALYELGQVGEAIESYDRALALKPGLARAHLGAGVALMAAGKAEGAVEAFRNALAGDPLLIDAYVRLGKALNELERFAEAEAVCREGQARKADHWEIELHLGTSLFQQERWDEAEPILRRVLDLKPDYLDTRIPLSMCLIVRGRHAEAEALLTEGLAIRPDHPIMRWNLALGYLIGGQLAKGWANLAARWQTAQQAGQGRSFSIPSFEGAASELAQKSVLLWAEQGVGDIITYASALPDLAACAKRVVFEAPDKLLPLFRRSFPGIEVRAIDTGRDAERTDCDVQIPVGDLFGLFRPTIVSFPADRRRYLVANPDAAARWRSWIDDLGPGLKVGIGWRSSHVTPTRLRHFFADLRAWGPILSQPGVRFIVLQPGEVEADVRQAEEAFGIALHRVPEIDLFNDLDGLSGLLAGLDLVVSNGTALAIQAAAQGVPVWMFLLKNAHWDLLGTEGLAWLPALRVFARQWGESWEGAVGAVAAALAERRKGAR
ncbi:MAG: tetratricopeptide repeat protein [Rhodospirillales bacterium]|nr:tetratricopeptide repeat protein [Rhodospirillales bacterium]